LRNYPISSRFARSRAPQVARPSFALSLSNFRCELRQIVNAELLLDAGDFVHHAVKTLFAEKLVFLFLEFFA
jgi:hypothetical protein